MHGVDLNKEPFWSILKSLESQPNTRLKMSTLSGHFSRVGQGSGRRVFALNDGFVLKVARNKKGIAQNRLEWQVCQDGEPREFLAQVVAAHPAGHWIIQERVSPLDLDQFEDWLRHDAGNFFFCLRFGSHTWKNAFFLKLTRFIERFDMDPFDISEESSWGMRNGKPVICDFGLNKTIAQKYYHLQY